MGHFRIKNGHSVQEECVFPMCFKLLAVGHGICGWGKNRRVVLPGKILSVIYEVFLYIQCFLPRELENTDGETTRFDNITGG